MQYKLLTIYVLLPDLYFLLYYLPFQYGSQVFHQSFHYGSQEFHLSFNYGSQVFHFSFHYGRQVFHRLFHYSFRLLYPVFHYFKLLSTPLVFGSIFFYILFYALGVRFKGSWVAQKQLRLIFFKVATVHLLHACLCLFYFLWLSTVLLHKYDFSLLYNCFFIVCCLLSCKNLHTGPIHNIKYLLK